MSGIVDFLVAKKSEQKAILKSRPNACTKWPAVSWKWCFQREVACLFLILRHWPKKPKLKDKKIEAACTEIEELDKAMSKTIDEETSALAGVKVHYLEGILYQLPTELIDRLAQTDESQDLEIAEAWHKYYDHWPAKELSELVRDLRKLCAQAKKAKKCVFLFDNCMY